jgi:hypothetical protein
MAAMKLTWDELKDESGTFYASMPFVIRAYGVGRGGEITYRLEGGGCDSKSPDVERLKDEAQIAADHAEFRKRLGV